MQQPPPPTTTKIIIKEKNLNEYPMGLGIDEINWNGLVFIANFILLYGCCVFPAAIFYIFFSIEFGTHRRRWVEHFIGACGKEFEKSKRKRCIALDSENIRARASQLNWNAIIFAVFTHQPDRFCYKSRIHSFNLRLSWVLPENEPSQRSHEHCIDLVYKDKWLGFNALFICQLFHKWENGGRNTRESVNCVCLRMHKMEDNNHCEWVLIIEYFISLLSWCALNAPHRMHSFGRRLIEKWLRGIAEI